MHIIELTGVVTGTPNVERNRENESGQLMHHPGLSRAGALDNRDIIGVVDSSGHVVDVVQKQVMKFSDIRCLPGTGHRYHDG